MVANCAVLYGVDFVLLLSVSLVGLSIPLDCGKFYARGVSRAVFISLLFLIMHSLVMFVFFSQEESSHYAVLHPYSSKYQSKMNEYDPDIDETSDSSSDM